MSSVSHGRILICYFERGSAYNGNIHEYIKMRKMVVQGLSPQLARHELEDVADEVLARQVALDTLLRHFHEYDLKPYLPDLKDIFIIPDTFDVADGSSVHRATHWVNILTDHEQVTEDDCCRWQLFVRSWAAPEDIVSNHWAEDILFLTMDPSLEAEVRSDIHRIPMDMRGAITTYYLMVNRVMVRNQEAQDR